MRTPIELVNTALSLEPAIPETKPALEISKVELLLNTPVKELTPEELIAALLDPSPIDTNIGSSVYSYYIRSFRTQVKHLQTVLDGLNADGFGTLEQLDAWQETLNDAPPLSYVTL